MLYTDSDTMLSLPVTKEKESPVESLFSQKLQTEVVKKVAELMLFKDSNLDIVELKTLDAFFSRCDFTSKTPETVMISKKEMEYIAGVKRIRSEVLLRHAKKIAQPQTISMGSQWILFTLFDSIAWINGKNGARYLMMKPSGSLVSIMNGIGQKGVQFYKYRRELTSHLKSAYGYWLTSYIIRNMFRGSWTVRLSDLKEEMNCKNVYEKNKYFMNDVLKPSVAEINEFKDINVSYRTVQDGRSAENGGDPIIEFTVKGTENLRKIGTETKKEIKALTKEEESAAQTIVKNERSGEVIEMETKPADIVFEREESNKNQNKKNAESRADGANGKNADVKTEYTWDDLMDAQHIEKYLTPKQYKEMERLVRRIWPAYGEKEVKDQVIMFCRKAMLNHASDIYMYMKKTLKSRLGAA